MPINMRHDSQSSLGVTCGNLAFEHCIFHLCHLFAMSVLLVSSIVFAETKPELTTAHEQLGGGLALFAATVVEGGGAKVNYRNPHQAVLDISEEFPKQWIASGRIPTGKQSVMFTSITGREHDGLNFEIPANGSRIIAFGDPKTPGGLDVYANLIYSDTQASRAAVASGRAPLKQSAWQGPLFFATIAAALAAIFLVWIRIEAGLVALVASIALLRAYESTIPAHIDIRVDYLLFVPLIVIAVISLLIATVRAANKK
jgi:hypothetical protein